MFIVVLFISLLAAFNSSLDATSTSKLNEIQPFNVLIHFGLGTRSHIKAVLEITNILASRGHSITYAAFDDDLKFSQGYNVTNRSIGPNPLSKQQNRVSELKRIKEGKQAVTVADLSDLLVKPMTLYYEKIYPELENLIKEERYDLIVCDYLSQACIDLAEHQGVPLIVGAQSIDFPGLNDAPFVTKSEYGPLTVETLSFCERFDQTILSPLKSLKHIWPLISKMNANREKIGLLPSNAVFGHTGYGLILSNSFVGFELAIPMSPNIIQVGPIISTNMVSLDNALSEFFETHSKIMYIAFGSIILLNHNEITKLLESILLALENKYIDGVIWGLGFTKPEDFPKIILYNNNTIETIDLLNNLHPNIRLLSWAPQETILKHSKTKLFISHCGLESIFETITSHTPIMCIPFLGDQPRNAKKVETIGIGQYVNKETANPSNIAHIINYLIVDPENTIQPNLDRISVISQYSSKRINLAADLMEQHILTAKACRPSQGYNPKTGDPPCELKHLVNVGNSIPYIKRNLLDIYAAAIIAVLSILVFSFSIICFILKLVYVNLFSKSNKSKKD